MPHALEAPDWARRVGKGMASLLAVVGAAIAIYGLSESLARWQWGTVLLAVGTALSGLGLFLRAGDVDRQINGAISIVSIGLCLVAANLFLELALPPGGVRQPERIRIARRPVRRSTKEANTRSSRISARRDAAPIRRSMSATSSLTERR